MTPSKYITALLLTLSIVLSYANLTETQKNKINPESLRAIYKHLFDIESKITQLNNTVAKIGVQDVERLTRENEQKDITIQAMRDYINSFDDKFWKGDE